MTSSVFLPRTALAVTLAVLLSACTSGVSEREAESGIPCPDCDKPDAAPKPPDIDAALPPPHIDAAPPPDIDAAPPEESGCTRTQGYWKRHNEHATSPGLQFDWPAPYDEDDLLCGQTLLDILYTPPQGDAWYILAHQTIAAQLNIASGASTTAEVDAALASAEAWLADNCGGSPASESPDALEWAETLAHYNQGQIGPGHCD